MNGSPVQLLSQGDGDFKVDKNAFIDLIHQEELKQCKLIVLSIVGEYRKGKSFFLNHVIKYLLYKDTEKDWMSKEVPNGGFKWKPGSERVTNGITMWSQAFPFDENYAVILLDTEGTYDEKSTNQKMSQVFGCSALCSSLQMFNVPGKITMQTMHEIQVFSEFGRSAQNVKNGSAFQSLLFLVRDWNYARETPYGEKGGQEHLNHWLNSNNEVRDTLKACYKNHSCYLMPPHKEYSKNTNANNINDFSPKFLEHIKRVIEWIFSSSLLQPKCISGMELKLGDFPEYFELFANTLQKCEAVPESLFKAQVYACMVHARQNAVEYYKKKMEEELLHTDPHEDLKPVHEVHMLAALCVFDESPKFGGTEFAIKPRKEVAEIIKTWYEKYEAKNDHQKIMKYTKDEKQKELIELRIRLSEMKMNIEHQKNMEELRLQTNEKDQELKLIRREMEFRDEENKKSSEYKLKLQRGNHEVDILKKTLEFKEKELEESINKLVDIEIKGLKKEEQLTNEYKNDCSIM